MATLIGAGVNILPSLYALGQTEMDNMNAVVEDIARSIENGSGLSSAMEAFPKVFSGVYIAMIRVAENTGNLHLSLHNMACWLEDEQQLRRRLKQALTYPVIVVLVTTVLTLLLFIKVMPGFVKIFEEMKVDLPFITQVLVAITKTLTSSWGWVSIFLISGTIIQIALPFVSSPRGQYKLFAFLLQMPFIGPLLRALTIGRFCKVASLMLPSGISMLAVLKLSAQASGSPVLSGDTKSLLKAMSDGAYMSDYMARKPKIYPFTLVQIVTVGEHTARLDLLLEKFGELYADEVNDRLDGLTAALEPVLLLGAAFVVGIVLAGVFLPLYGFLGSL